MFSRKLLGRAVFFGLGYVVGTRAGRERYAQIEAGFKTVVEKLRQRYAENVTTAENVTSAGNAKRTSASPSGGDGYSDIRLGD
jgi:hypothetical protein